MRLPASVAVSFQVRSDSVSLAAHISTSPIAIMGSERNASSIVASRWCRRDAVAADRMSVL
jgi:hypothetical protein